MVAAWSAPGCTFQVFLYAEDGAKLMDPERWLRTDTSVVAIENPEISPVRSMSRGNYGMDLQILLERPPRPRGIS